MNCSVIEAEPIAARQECIISTQGEGEGGVESGVLGGDKTMHQYHLSGKTALDLNSMP